jgi:hypothetical protein
VTDPMGFTLGEMKACHAALMESKKHLEAHSAEIIKENGRDVYDTVWRDVGTALEKITMMAKAAIEGENDG